METALPQGAGHGQTRQKRENYWKLFKAGTPAQLIPRTSLDSALVKPHNVSDCISPHHYQLAFAALPAPVTVVGPSRGTSTAAASVLDYNLRVVTIGAAVNPFLRAADDLGLGPIHFAGVEPHKQLAGMNEWLGENPPDTVYATVHDMLQDVASVAFQANVDMLLATWTDPIDDLLVEGHPEEDPLHKWCVDV